MLAFVITMLIVGLIVGAIARLLVPGPDPMGCLGTAVLGAAGSFVGGFLADLLFGRSAATATLHPAGLVGSVVGAIVLLIVLRLFRR
ncbi:MAG TPA: GlsB/YeaQ/YmgE family stress response membrane protein [Kineosporiaceae bacterium]